MSTVPVRRTRPLALALALSLLAASIPGRARAQNDETPFGGQPVVFRQIAPDAPVVHWDDSDNRPSHTNRGPGHASRAGRR